MHFGGGADFLVTHYSYYTNNINVKVSFVLSYPYNYYFRSSINSSSYSVLEQHEAQSVMFMFASQKVFQKHTLHPFACRYL